MTFQGSMSAQDRLQLNLQSLKENVSRVTDFGQITPKIIKEEFLAFLTPMKFQENMTEEFKQTLDTINEIADADTNTLPLHKKLELINYLKDNLTEISKTVLSNKETPVSSSIESKKAFCTISEGLFSNIRKNLPFRENCSPVGKFKPSLISIEKLAPIVTTFFDNPQLETKNTLFGKKEVYTPLTTWLLSLTEQKNKLIKNLKKKAQDHTELASITPPSPATNSASDPLIRASDISNFVEAPTAKSAANHTATFTAGFKLSKFDKNNPFTSINLLLNSEQYTPEQKQEVLSKMDLLFSKTQDLAAEQLSPLHKNIETDVTTITETKKPGLFGWVKSTPKPIEKQIHDAINKHLKTLTPPLSLD